MSVWPKPMPECPSLSSSEGDLVSVSIHLEPHDLESLLEALALVSFPINPQIYHEADMAFRYADGHNKGESAPRVDSPAYEARLDEVRASLSAFGFPPDCLQ